MAPEKTNRISFQGEPGANSDTACRNMFPHMEPLPCPTFEDAFNAVESGKADLAMIPIDNTIAGRVADIHSLLPESKLHIIGEYFLPIHFHLMVLPGVIGVLQATEAIKLVLGAGETLAGRLVLYDALAARFRELKLRRDPACKTCAAGVDRAALPLIDYDAFCAR